MTTHPITQRPPSTYFYPQQSSTSSTSQKSKSHTRVEKASGPPTNAVTDYTNYNYNNIPQSGKFSSLITNVDKTPPIGVSIIQKSPKYAPDVAIETEDVKEEGEVITFWVDNPNDIPDIANANSYFHETPSSFLEGIGNNRKHDGQSFDAYDDGKNYIETQHHSLPGRPSSSETDAISNSPIDYEPSGTLFNPPEFKSPSPLNFFASPELKLTKSTETPSTYFSTSVINPQDYYGGFGTKTFGLESRTKERENAHHSPTSYSKHRKTNYDTYPDHPSQRGGRYNKLTRFSARDARDKRKSEIYFSDAYLQGDFVQEDEDVEDVVQDDFLEEGEYLSNGEADLAFEKDGDSNPSLFSPDAPYRTNDGKIEESEAYSYPATEEEQVFIYKESEEKEEEEEKEVEPITEPPKKTTRYKSTTSINKYKSKSSINKYKSQFEIKQHEQNRKPKSETSKRYKQDSSYPITTTSKPKEAPSQVPTTYIKYSDTVPKSEIAQESGNEGGEENSYTDSHNSVFHSEDFSPGKFLTPENFEIPQEFRTFLSKPPSWINMENW